MNERWTRAEEAPPVQWILQRPSAVALFLHLFPLFFPSNIFLHLECASEFPEEDIVAINSMVVKWYKDTEPYHTKEDWDNYFKGQSEAVSELILLSKLKTVTELADIISAARTTHATFLKSKPITALSFTKALLFSDNKSLLINFLGVPKEKIVVLVSQVITFARERAANRTAAELQSILSVLIN